MYQKRNTNEQHRNNCNQPPKKDGDARYKATYSFRREECSNHSWYYILLA